MMVEHHEVYDFLLCFLFLASIFPMLRLIDSREGEAEIDSETSNAEQGGEPGETETESDSESLLPQRAVAFDSLAINTAGILALISIRMKTDVYVEAILIIALLGFLGTLAIARFIERGQLIIIDAQDEDDDDADEFHPTDPTEFIEKRISASQFAEEKSIAEEISQDQDEEDRS